MSFANLKVTKPGTNSKFRRIKAPPEKHELKAQNFIEQSVSDEILEEAHELFDATYGVIRPGPWKRAFRPSGLPYCPVLDAMSGPEALNYGKAFYLDIGTTVHELMQEYISRSPTGNRKIYANWKCKDCGGEHIFTPLPFACAFCKADSERLSYEEVSFENFRGLGGGHIDLLFKTKHGWIVADWKTASTMGLDYRNEAEEKHHHQLQAYCLAIEELFKDKLQGLPVIGYMLIFVPRDASGARNNTGSNWTPYIYAWDKELARATRRRLFMQHASYLAADIGYETGNWLPAALLRPCESLADFGAPMGMRDAFYKGELCANLATCSKGADGVVTLIKNAREMMTAVTIATETIKAELRADLLKCADKGYVSPDLLKVIEAEGKAENYDYEKHEALLALKQGIEAYIQTHMRLKSTAFWSKGEKPKAI